MKVQKHLIDELGNLSFNQQKFKLPILSLYFILFNSVESKFMFHLKICHWLDANCRPLVLEATALPTEPQPQPHKHYFVSKHLPIELRWDKQPDCFPLKSIYDRKWRFTYLSVIWWESDLPWTSTDVNLLVPCNLKRWHFKDLIDQCDLITRLFVQYLVIYKRINLPICNNKFPSRFKILPNTK